MGFYTRLKSPLGWKTPPLALMRIEYKNNWLVLF